MADIHAALSADNHVDLAAVSGTIGIEVWKLADAFLLIEKCHSKVIVPDISMKMFSNQWNCITAAANLLMVIGVRMLVRKEKECVSIVSGILKTKQFQAMTKSLHGKEQTLRSGVAVAARQSLDNVSLPSVLQQLTFGERFTQSLGNVCSSNALQQPMLGISAKHNCNEQRCLDDKICIAVQELIGRPLQLVPAMRVRVCCVVFTIRTLLLSLPLFSLYLHVYNVYRLA